MTSQPPAKGQRVFVVAEAGVNHEGDPARAMALVEAAAAAGADAVKFQTFRADRLVVAGAPKARYQAAASGADEDQFDMLRRLELTPDSNLQLAAHAKACGIEFMSTAFDEDSVDFLVDEVGVKRLKVPSGEVTNGPLLLHISRRGLPIILSTGMSHLTEVEAALGVLAFGMTQESPPSQAAFAGAFASSEGQAALREKVGVLHCTSEYPAPLEDVNLRAMATLCEAFELPVGLSDHTSGISVAIAAAALGASIVEKHFTLDRSLSGPDHKASLLPDELKQMIGGIRMVEQALGTASKQPTSSELANRDVARRSLVATAPIRKGERFTEQNLAARRPGGGISPMSYWDVLGQSASRDYAAGEPVAT